MQILWKQLIGGNPTFKFERTEFNLKHFEYINRKTCVKYS